MYVGTDIDLDEALRIAKSAKRRSTKSKKEFAEYFTPEQVTKIVRRLIVCEEAQTAIFEEGYNLGQRVNATKHRLPKKPLLPYTDLGQCHTTKAGMEALFTADENVASFLPRHMTGDWGEVTPKQKRLNDKGAKNGGRLISKFTLSNRVPLVIVTEGDRSNTTIMTANEFQS
jgi:hypothetical protein